MPHSQWECKYKNWQNASHRSLLLSHEHCQGEKNQERIVCSRAFFSYEISLGIIKLITWNIFLFFGRNASQITGRFHWPNLHMAYNSKQLSFMKHFSKTLETTDVRMEVFLQNVNTRNLHQILGHFQYVQTSQKSDKRIHYLH